MNDSTGNLLLYQTEDGHPKIEVALANDTVWLTADQMAEFPPWCTFLHLGDTDVTGIPYQRVYHERRLAETCGCLRLFDKGLLTAR